MPLILLNKPYRVLSQFHDTEGRKTLADFIEAPDVYPAGRLDYDSEGLILLTDDGQLQAKISSPKRRVTKCYWSQIDGQASPVQLKSLVDGVILKDGIAHASYASTIPTPATIWPRDPPIRVRKSLPTQWLDIAITEGRNRQVRRMTAAVNLPTLRLLRHAVGPWQLGSLDVGESRIIESGEAWQQLNAYLNTAV